MHIKYRKKRRGGDDWVAMMTDVCVIEIVMIATITFI